MDNIELRAGKPFIEWRIRVVENLLPWPEPLEPVRHIGPELFLMLDRPGMQLIPAREALLTHVGRDIGLLDDCGRRLIDAMVTADRRRGGLWNSVGHTAPSVSVCIDTGIVALL